MSWFCWSGTVGNAPVSLLQTCFPASMVASVFTQLSVTADASMPPGLVASWVRLISPAPGEAVGPRPKSSAVPTSLQHGARTDLASICLVSVYNAGPERDSICRSWGQYHVETFDGLYYYLSGKGSYLLVGHHEPESQSFSIQVRPLLSVCLSMQAPPGPGSWGRLGPLFSTFPGSWDCAKPLLTHSPLAASGRLFVSQAPMVHTVPFSEYEVSQWDVFRTTAQMWPLFLRNSALIEKPPQMINEFVISSAVVSRAPDLDTVKNGDDRLLIGSDIY